MTIVVIKLRGDGVDMTGMAATFNLAREDYTQVAPLLWDPAGAATVRVTAPAPGEQVLDACCGIGSSALPAAHAVGPGGTVDAVDVAGDLLAEGRATARRRGLTNIRFVEADVTGWSGERPYDLVQCVFGVFMLPDLDRDTAQLISLLRPGGRFGVTVWAKGAMEDFGRTLYEVVTRYRPEQAERPAIGSVIERINTEPLLRTWLTSLGLRDVELHRDTRSIPLAPATAWSLVAGTGFRGLLTGFEPATVDAVRTGLLAALTERGIHTTDTSALTAVGRRHP